MKPLFSVRCFVLVFGFLGLAIPAAAADRPPNVLLILADDLGFSDLGCQGSEIATPHLDSIAQSGLQYTQFYNTGRCWPTRGSLLTGYYAQQIRRDALRDVLSGGVGRGTRPAWAPLLPRMLSKVGYRSYHSGKWHIDGMPVAEGFDRSYRLDDQSRFFSPQSHFKDDQKLAPVKKNSGYYGTTAVADHAIEVLTEHAEKHAEKPFFHYLAFAAPHFPLQALPQDIEVYQDRYRVGWDVIARERWERMKALGLMDAGAVGRPARPERDLGPPYHLPESLEILGDNEVNRPLAWESLSSEQKRFQSDKMAVHAAMIHRMDLEIGRVLDQIKKMDQWEDTLIVFLSDNGASAEIMVRGDGHDPDAVPGSAETYLCLGPGWSTCCNTPFRRHKTWTHEGGISTPLILSWPNGISAHGEFRNAPGHVIDMVPTVLEIAGAQPFCDDGPPMPGQSMVSSFEPSSDSDSDDSDRDDTPERTLWWFHDGHRAMRVGDWKAVAPISEPWELYDMSKDRDESTDLAIPQGDQLDALVAMWETQLNETTRLAKADLTPDQLAKAKENAGFPMWSQGMLDALNAARPRRHQVLPSGKSFMIGGRHAFIMAPGNVPEKVDPAARDKPWIFYGPTLPRYPDQAESWMHQKFLDAGIAVAGIDVGEAYGSPHSLRHFDALHQHMVSLGYSDRPALLGRSRGGLWVMRMAIEHPQKVAGIGGIYPAYDYTTYPGVERAAPVYGVTAEELQSRQGEFNPIKRAEVLAKAKIPVFIIHGIDDKVVRLDKNAAVLEEIYQDHGQADLIEVMKIPGQGHSFWQGYFHCQELVDFLIAHALDRSGS